MDTVTDWAIQNNLNKLRASEIAEKLASLSRLLDEIERNGGFLTQINLAQLARLDRLRMVLVRCGGGRFTCPAQDADHFMAIIDAADSGDYVRDVSLPTSDPIYRNRP